MSKLGQRIIEEAAALPELPIVLAQSMLYAQAYVPTASEQAAIDAYKRFFVKLWGHGGSVAVRVIDFGGCHIGNLEFRY